MTALAVFAAVPAAGEAVAAPARIADDNSALVMVLDSSGSMADDDGSGDSRIESARTAVGTLVDALPDNYPTGLRLYGSQRQQGCTDTTLAHPVKALDREALKQAVDGVEPKGDTPTGLALRKAVDDLPEPSQGALGRRTVVLISDGESNCPDPAPCEVAEQLAEKHVDLRIDTIGFQVGGRARAELSCIAEKGNGSYREAEDAEDLARELERAGKLSAEGYRFEGKRVEGAAREAGGPVLAADGQYLDTIGAGESRWYRLILDGDSTTDITATAVPNPGTEVRYGDGLRLRLRSLGDRLPRCDIRRSAHFGQSEGALPVTAGLSRVPSHRGTAPCDRAGTFALEVHRPGEEGTRGERWPVELRLETEEPLEDGVTPGASATRYGSAGGDAPVPSGTPRDVEGGTGFNDATELGKGVWRDKILPSQTRWYKVPVGWGQQLRYDIEFGNEPRRSGSTTASFVRAQTYNPHRQLVTTDGEFRGRASYRGDPAAVSQGTVPVSWTNRYESLSHVAPVRMGGAYYIAVALGGKAAELAENPRIGVVLRIDVVGEAKSGPAHDAPPAESGKKGSDGKEEPAAAHASEGPVGGWSPMVLGLAGAAGAVLLAGVWVAYAARRRRGMGSGGAV